MKIEKLYTLSNFIQYLRQFTFNELRNLDLAEKFRRVIKYDYFIKQPPKKEYFVNEINKPFDDDEKYMNIWLSDISEYDFNEAEYNIDLKAWKEAEKKVIFEGFVIIKSKSKKDNLTLTNGDIFISIAFKDQLVCYSKNDYVYSTIESMNQLAYKTNNSLSLKNVQL